MRKARAVYGSLLAIVFLFSAARWSHAQSSPPEHASGGAGAQMNGASPAMQAPAQADQQAPPYQSASVLKAVTRMVVVDVVATNKKEEPITDLKQSDFTVVEDGKDQAIKVFSFQQPPQQPAPVDLALTKVKLPPNVVTNIPSYKPDSALNVILLDGLNTTMPNQAYVRDQMIRYLERMPDDRPVAVYLLGAKLRLLQDFTTDHATLKEVVRKLKMSASPLLDSPADGAPQELLPPGVADSGMLPPSMLNAMMAFEQERVASQTDLRVAYTLTAMNTIARQLAGYAGRKNLIWISEAFPLAIDPNMQLNNVFAGTRNYGPELAAAAEAMIDSQIAIYPIDARGLLGSSYFTAASTGRDSLGRALTIGGRMGDALGKESTSLEASHESMQDLAESTGGKAFYSQNDFESAIRRSIDDGSTYYTLAYYPSDKKWDGRFRKIHVKVNRPGVKLRYRLGYYAVDPRNSTKQSEKLQAANFSDAMSIQNPIATALAFHAGVVTPSAGTQYKVYVNFGVDPHAIGFDEDSSGLHHAQLECAIAAFSEKGKYVKSIGGVSTADLKPETFSRLMQGLFPCQQNIELPPGNYSLRLGVRDMNTGLIGSANAKVSVPAAEADGAKGK